MYPTNTRGGIAIPMIKIRQYVKTREEENIMIVYAKHARARPNRHTLRRPNLSARGVKRKEATTTAMKKRLPKRPI